jgi:predicted AAA+ superfamily ATPase
MPDNVISLSSRRPLQSNGAREALIEILRERFFVPDHEDAAARADTLLASLWAHGFKVVPIDKE